MSASSRFLPTLVRPALLVALLAALLATTGCAARLNRHSIIDQRGAQIDLVTIKDGLFSTKVRSFEHPAIISLARMKNILGAIEVETSEGNGRFLRQPAIHPEIIDEAAAALVKAFAESDPNSELGVQLIRKEANLGIFHRKFLTTFLANMKEDHLNIVFSRIDWPIPQAQESKKLPEPKPGGSSAGFRVVGGDPLFYAGPQALEIAWRSPAFTKPYRLPGSAKGERRVREVIAQESVPASEQQGSGGASSSNVGNLSPEKLRALADLEEDRRAGKITETAYQRAKRQLFRTQ